MSSRVRKVGFVAVAAVSLTLVASAEKKVPRSELPPAVEKTVREQSKGADITGISSETEDGVFQYEIEMTVSGHGRDIAIAKDGTLLEVEEEVAMNNQIGRAHV